jgi:diguanylate cyclase (GGDEF)-like protein
MKENTAASTLPPPPARPSGASSARSDSQRRQGLVDVERRALGGIFVYLPYWLGVTAVEGLDETEPKLVAAVALVWLVLAVARYALRRNFPAHVERNEPQARTLLAVLVLGNGLLLSLLGVGAQHWPPLSPVLHPLILAGGIICAVATMTMGMEGFVRYGMPTVMLVPFMIGQAFPFNVANAASCLIIALFMLYLVKASRHVHDDYWGAVEARASLEERAAELEQLSLTDPLTQIPNRLYFERRLADEWARALRNRQPISVLMIDIDHFKRVNDKFGHPFGDRCLVAVAVQLRRTLYRDVDTVARCGGEEFVAVLPDTGAEAAAAVADRVRLAVASLALTANGVRVPFTCSIGVVTVEPRSSEQTPAAAIVLADRALYEAKAAGRDRVVAVPATADATGQQPVPA